MVALKLFKQKRQKREVQPNQPTSSYLQKPKHKEETRVVLSCQNMNFFHSFHSSGVKLECTRMQKSFCNTKFLGTYLSMTTQKKYSWGNYRTGGGAQTRSAFLDKGRLFGTARALPPPTMNRRCTSGTECTFGEARSTVVGGAWREGAWREGAWRGTSPNGERRHGVPVMCRQDSEKQMNSQNYGGSFRLNNESSVVQPTTCYISPEVFVRTRGRGGSGPTTNPLGGGGLRGTRSFLVPKFFRRFVPK